MTRFLAVDIKDLPIENVLVVTGSILVLTLAVFVLEIATSKFATPNALDGHRSVLDKATTVQ